VHAADRETARLRMLRALSDFVVLGIATTIDYLREIVASEAFARGETQTDFIEKHMAPRGRGAKAARADDGALEAALAAGALFLSAGSAPAGGGGRRRERSPWDTLGAWSVGRRSS
jgi:acetyl/propionyl-CoA carboxylase alpha subunit